MFPIYKALPSFVTLLALILGINAIHFAISGEIEKAIFFIIIACILDLLDGRLARYLKASSAFGAELDSFSDLICFGVASTFIILFSREYISKILYLSSIFFTVATVIRLAKFNITEKNPIGYENFFVGLPTPAAFGMAITPIALENIFLSLSISNISYAIYLFLLGFLMISPLPTPSTKGITIPRSLLPLVLGFIALIISIFISYPWIVIIMIYIVYIINIVITNIIFINRKKTNNIKFKR